MHSPFIKTASSSILPVTILIPNHYEKWLTTQDHRTTNWLKHSGFVVKTGELCCVPDEQGAIKQVVYGLDNAESPWKLATLLASLPAGQYRLINLHEIFKTTTLQFVSYLVCGMAFYQFDRYRKLELAPAKIMVPPEINFDQLHQFLTAMNWVRDLVNTPAEDMGPAQLAAAIKTLGTTFKAKVKIYEGDELLKHNFPLVHAVGRGSHQAPCFIDLTWGNKHDPKITLVGKGVCFDSGGYNLKSSSGMLLMKKDMLGAAHAMGLAHLIMAAKLPVRLRLLVPAVENLVAGNSIKPSDVIRSRAGISVEVTNTDAEGRLVLADALALASEENPHYIFDFASLTGAVASALGPKIAGLFTPNEQLATSLMNASKKVSDSIWQLPLFKDYRAYLDSDVADIANSSSQPFAGATTAGLFLQEFVTHPMQWAHFDFRGWNSEALPGFPRGAMVMAIRSVFELLTTEFGG